jgi:hypothetical protein
MKRLFLSALLVAGATLLAPRADACDERRAILYYDECGRPVYGYVKDDDRYYGGSRYTYYQTGYDYDDSYHERVYRPRWEHHRRRNLGFTFVFGR